MGTSFAGTMDLILASRLCGVARAAYAPDPTGLLTEAGAERVDVVRSRNFRGAMISSERAACLVFRGTKLDLASAEGFRDTLQAWLTNLDYAPVARGDSKLHGGWARQIERIEDELVRLAQEHGAGTKPLFVTGHSAGGALAILAAERLHAAGVPVRGVVAFAAPRVGDRHYAASYPVPLARIEHRHDLVPHLPLPPSLTRVLGTGLVDRILDGLAWSGLVAGARAYRMAGAGYVHAGHLFYDDGASLLFRVPPGAFRARYGSRLKAELAADLRRRPLPPLPPLTGCPSFATPVPARLMDLVRLPRTLAEVALQLRGGRLDFLLDHHLDAATRLLDRLRPAA